MKNKTKWPAEVESIFAKVPTVANLPEHLQAKIRYHINLLCLAKLSEKIIVSDIELITQAMEGSSK